MGDKLLYKTFLEYSYLDQNTINLIIEYGDELIYLFKLKFKKEKISVIKELDENRLMIGFMNGKVCVHDLSDKNKNINGTKIKTKIIKNPRKKHISALCYIPGTNKIVCG